MYRNVGFVTPVMLRVHTECPRCGVAHEATHAARMVTTATDCPVHVTPILAMVGAPLTGQHLTAGDVRTVSAGHLAQALRSRPQVLSPEDARHLFEIARRSTTWTP